MKWTNWMSILDVEYHGTVRDIVRYSNTQQTTHFEISLHEISQMYIIFTQLGGPNIYHAPRSNFSKEFSKVPFLFSGTVSNKK